MSNVPRSNSVFSFRRAIKLQQKSVNIETLYRKIISRGRYEVDRLVASSTAPVFRRRAVEQDLETELAFFVDQRTDKNRTDGMTPAEARRVALASAGSITSVKENCLDARGFRWIEDLFQDVRH